MSKRISIYKKGPNGYVKAITGYVNEGLHNTDLEILGSTALHSRSGLTPHTWTIERVRPGSGKRLLEPWDMVRLGSATYMFDGNKFFGTT